MFCVCVTVCFTSLVFVGFSNFEDVSHWGCWEETINLRALDGWYVGSIYLRFVGSPNGPLESFLWKKHVEDSKIWITSGDYFLLQKNPISAFRCVCVPRGFSGELVSKITIFQYDELPNYHLQLGRLLGLFQSSKQANDCFYIGLNYSRHISKVELHWSSETHKRKDRLCKVLRKDPNINIASIKWWSGNIHV